MTITDFFILVASICLAAVAVAIIPAVFQIRRTFKKTETLLDTLNNDIEPLSKSLTSTAAELEVLATNLNDKVKKTDKIIDTVQDSAYTLLKASNMVKGTTIPLVAQISGIRAGLKAFTYFFSKSSKTS